MHTKFSLRKIFITTLVSFSTWQRSLIVNYVNQRPFKVQDFFIVCISSSPNRKVGEKALKEKRTVSQRAVYRMLRISLLSNYPYLMKINIGNCSKLSDAKKKKDIKLLNY